jgi:hypothetical protein
MHQDSSYFSCSVLSFIFSQTSLLEAGTEKGELKRGTEKESNVEDRITH